MTDNPWNLTSRQCEVMDQLIKDGCAKVAMVNLGICSGSIYEHMRKIYKKMGIPPGTYRHILMWYEWRRSEEDKAKDANEATTDRMALCRRETGPGAAVRYAGNNDHAAGAADVFGWAMRSAIPADLQDQRVRDQLG